MREVTPQIEAAGANVVAVSGKSVGMAKSLQATMPFPLLLDPEHTLRATLGIGKLSIAQIMGLRSVTNYTKVLGGIRNATVQPSEASQTPVVVILNADQTVAWQHVGKALGDYPNVEEVIARIPSS